MTKYFGLKARILVKLIRKRKLTVKKAINALHCYVAYFLKLERSAKTPFLINFELSNHCNESCVFCRNEEGQLFDLNPKNEGSSIEKGTMKFEVFESILRQSKDTLMMAVPYVNGEPFIYKHFSKALEVANANNVATMIATNGLLLNDENIQIILDHDLDFIKIHVSGFTNPVHQIQHRIGDVELIKANLQNLAKEIQKRQSLLLVMIDYIRYKHNHHELELFRKFSEDLGFMFSIRPGNPLGLEGSEDLQPIDPYVNTLPCDWLWKVLTVNWNGDLLPCCDYVVWKNVEGYGRFDVGSTYLQDVWNGTSVVQMRRTHRDQGRDPIPICSQCTRKGIEFKF